MAWLPSIGRSARRTTARLYCFGPGCRRGKNCNPVPADSHPRTAASSPRQYSFRPFIRRLYQVICRNEPFPAIARPCTATQSRREQAHRSANDQCDAIRFRHDDRTVVEARLRAGPGEPRLAVDLDVDRRSAVFAMHRKQNHVPDNSRQFTRRRASSPSVSVAIRLVDALRFRTCKSPGMFVFTRTRRRPTGLS